ncbi:MAG: glycosyltransferase [Planctomycetota bacterium]|nr:glycosyltransferase [Planctomycetota bacterium]
MNVRSRRLALAAILIASAAVRLYHVSAPMADTLQAKQIYVANKARSIARAPMNPLRNTLDFLDDRGGRMALTEEVPLYHGLLGLGYRVFGERDWVGHALSLLGTLAALLAFFDLVRREWDDRSALVATVLLSASPLFIFYGRAVLPEPWMLAGMLASAACYRRYLDSAAKSARRWLVAASIAGLAAALFKYFGLMVLVPLAAMAWRDAGSWRGLRSRSFLTMAAVMIAPVFAWIVVVFLRSPNPLRSGWVDGKVYPYLILQAPEVLLAKPFWAGLFGRFLVRDCGPVTAVLIGVGVLGTWFRTRRDGTGRLDASLGTLGAWTVMGLSFYVLLGPKLCDHDYYELMMLPAAALWATRGLQTLGRLADAREFSLMQAFPAGLDRSFPVGRASPPTYSHRNFLVDGPGHPAHDHTGRSGTRPALAILALAVIVQSPWISGGLFRQDEGKLALAGRLRALCPPDGRVVAIGPGIEFPTVVHYSHREGWPVHSPFLPADWRPQLARYRASGATLIAVYFEPKATAAQRASYAPLLHELPVVERHSGARSRAGGPSEFIILSLRDAKNGPR